MNGGYENTSNYENSELKFCDIQNIHAVRESYDRTQELILKSNQGEEASFWASLEKNLWLAHISTILKAVNSILEVVRSNKMNVLIHCTDGWDRTAQLCSLA